MAPATAASMLLPLRRAPSSKLWPTATATFAHSSPDPEDRLGGDFDAPGRLDMRVLQELGVPRNGDFYICGPTAFISDLTAGLAAWASPQVASTPRFSAWVHPIPRASPRRRAGRRTCRQARPAGDRWSRSPEQSGCPLGAGIPEPARACRSVRRTCAMVVSNGGLPHL